MPFYFLRVINKDSDSFMKNICALQANVQFFFSPELEVFIPPG